MQDEYIVLRIPSIVAKQQGDRVNNTVAGRIHRGFGSDICVSCV